MVLHTYCFNILFILIISAQDGLNAMGRQLSTSAEPIKNNVTPYFIVPESLTSKKYSLKPRTAYLGTAVIPLHSLNHVWKNAERPFKQAVFIDELALQNTFDAVRDKLKMIREMSFISQSLEKIRKSIEKKDSKDDVSDTIASIITIIHNVNSSDVIPKITKDAYTAHAAKILAQANEQFQMIEKKSFIKGIDGVINAIEYTTIASPLIAIAPDSPPAEVLVGIAEMDTKYKDDFFRSTPTKNYRQLNQQINTLCEVIECNTSIFRLISLLYITETLKDRVTENNIITDDQKALLNKNIKQQKNKIISKLTQEAEKERNYSLDQTRFFVKLINNLLLKKIVNVNDDFLDDLELRHTIAVLASCACFNIDDQIIKNPQYSDKLKYGAAILNNNFDVLVILFHFHSALRKKEQELQSLLFMR